MNCEACGMKTTERKATSNAPYKYTLSGLKNVFLIGITVKECQNCHEEYPIIPAMEELHNLIAENLIKKSEKLRGEEIRFLRKNAGISSQEFASRLTINPSTLSRIEAGKENISLTVDKMARLVGATAFVGDEKLRKLILDQIERTMNGKPTFQLDGKGWKPLKAA